MTLPYTTAGRVYFLVCFAAFAAVVLGSSHPPLLRDYPDWVYQGALLAKTLSGHPATGYILKQYPVPNSITTVALALLTLAFGWMWAAKLWLVVYLAIAAATASYVANTFRAREIIWWVVPGVLFFGQAFWFGTISFNIGVCLLLVLGCLLYRQDERALLIGGLLLLCFFMHLIVYAAAGVMMLLYSIQRQRWRPTLIGLATLPLPLWYFVGRSLSHSNETEFGYSPVSHLALPAVVAALCLGVALVWPRRILMRTILPGLLVLGPAVLLGALASTVIPTARLTPRLLSAITLLRLKALAPFQLFGFVNVIYQPNARPLLSATVTLLHRPLFIALMVLTFAVGLAMTGGLGRRMFLDRRETPDLDARFLWDFAALFSLLYFVCPPNALGVISIDMRLLQLALYPAIFLFARCDSRILRAVCAPLVLLVAASLYQFAASQRRVELPVADTRMNPQLGAFGAVKPTAIIDEYDRLRTGKFEGFIWTTGIYSQTIPWKRDCL